MIDPYEDWLIDQIATEQRLERHYQRPRGGFSTSQKFHGDRATAFKQALDKYRATRP